MSYCLGLTGLAYLVILEKKRDENINMSVQEYIAYEIEDSQKFEYNYGQLFALAGGSIEHALLVGNIYPELRNGLRKKDANCKPITSEAKLHIKRENKYVYSDSIVICGAIERSIETKDAVTNPTLLKF